MPKRWLVAVLLLGVAAVVLVPSGDGEPDEEPARWRLAEEPDPGDEVLPLLVTATGCDGRASGDVDETGDEVRIRIVVRPDDGDCRRDVERTVEIRLDDPLGDREIVAVDCPDGPARPASEPGCP